MAEFLDFILDLWILGPAVLPGELVHAVRDLGLSRIRISTRPDVSKYRPEEFVDASFLEELDKTGFIKKLFGN